MKYYNKNNNNATDLPGLHTSGSSIAISRGGANLSKVDRNPVLIALVSTLPSMKMNVIIVVLFTVQITVRHTLGTNECF